MKGALPRRARIALGAPESFYLRPGRSLLPRFLSTATTALHCHLSFDENPLVE